MLISHKHKFITIDIPKTGTRSLRESLVPLGIIAIVGQPNLNSNFYQHGTALQCSTGLRKLNKNFLDYFSFTIVRNPWDRYYSFFKYFKEYAEKYKNKDSSIIWNEPEINQGQMCLAMFENQDDKTVMKHIINNNKPQHEDYTINNEIVVNQVAEFENINEEFANFCSRNNIESINLKHGNKSQSNSDFTCVMDNELIDKIYELEKPTIEYKKYTL